MKFDVKVGGLEGVPNRFFGSPNSDEAPVVVFPPGVEAVNILLKSREEAGFASDGKSLLLKDDVGRPAGVKDRADDGGGPAGVVEGLSAIDGKLKVD
jgi:hypothetical protein